MKKNLFQYKNVDILKTLEVIAAGNTHHYLQNDFEIDKEILMENAKKKHPEIMLWMSRDCGTWCLSERNVFMKNSVSFQTWTYYENAYDNILAFVVEPTDIEDDVLVGNLYELNYRSHVNAVRQSAVRADNRKFIFENGTAVYPASEFNKWQYGHPDFGKYQTSIPVPNDGMALEAVLMEEKKKRDKLMEGDIRQKTDAILKKLWSKLGDVPVDPETEKLDSDFLFFKKGADKYEDVWRWFDNRYSGGVATLLGLT